MTRVLPNAILARLLGADPTSPRLTCYDDTDSPTRGERIELSARVIRNWVAKAANLLQDEFDISTGMSVRLALPAHWRTAYWALAVWTVGATVVLGPPEEVPDPGDLMVTITDDDALAARVDPAVLVTLAGLARHAPAPVPAGVLDEARDLATFPDDVEPWDEADPHDPALLWAAGSAAYGEIVTDHPGGRVHLLDPDPVTFLRTALATWGAGGSIVLTRGRPDEAVLAARLASEHVTS